MSSSPFFDPSFDVPRLQYHAPSRCADTTFISCAVAGLIGAVVYSYMFVPPCMYHEGQKRISAMIASARKTASAALVDAHVVYPEHVVEAGVVLLVDAKGASASNPLACSDISDDEKEQCRANAEAFLRENPSAVVTLFAAWCPHCKSTMRSICDEAVKHPEVKYLLVNAESLPSTAFQGPERFLGVDLKYYPTIVAKTPTAATTVQSVQEATMAAKTPVADDKVDDKEADAEPELVAMSARKTTVEVRNMQKPVLTGVSPEEEEVGTKESDSDKDLFKDLF